jgi:hypothetical protein
MHIRYDDILSRIDETPKWWLDGVPRYDDFRPEDLNVYASEALLVHIQCQFCRHDFHIGLWDPGPYSSTTFRILLLTNRTIGVGDPPNACPDACAGASAGAEEIAVLQFWERKSGNPEWKRVPELERGLWTADEELREGHREAWRRIRVYQSRPANFLPKWTPLPIPREFPPRLPSPITDRCERRGPPVNSPMLNTRRRLLLLALSGRITESEFAALGNAHQREFAPFEQRPEAPRPEWAQPLANEVRAIDEAEIASAISHYPTLTQDQKEERYCVGIDTLFHELATTGRLGQDEKRDLYRVLLPSRYSRTT